MNRCSILYVSSGITLWLAVAGLYAGEIHDAATAGDLDKVKSLLATNPMLLDARDPLNHTPLHLACWHKQVTVANYLMAKGANVKARNEYGVTVLSCAIDGHDRDVWFDIVKRLIDKGADIHVTKSALGSPMHRAAEQGNMRVVKLLIEHGGDMNVRGRHGTPLQMNIIFGAHPQEETAIFLVEKGAKAQAYSFGNNDLHLAAIKGYADLIHVMVKHSFDIHAVNDYGHTPLYYAARHGHRPALDVLVAAGADKSTMVETNVGQAVQLTRTLQHSEAYLWYLGGIAPGTGYAVKTKHHLLIFDPFKINTSPEAGLANGHLNPHELAGQNIIILVTRKLPHAFHPTVRELATQLPDADFVLGFKPEAGNGDPHTIPAYHLALPNASLSVRDMKIHTIQTRSSTLRSTGNVGYLVDVDGIKVFHAGLHCTNGEASQTENYRRQIDFLESFGPIDVAILPIAGRHLGPVDYAQYLYLIDRLSPQALYLIGDDLIHEEHRTCLTALEKRDIPVFYPDGGIAMGQRFFYRRSVSD